MIICRYEELNRYQAILPNLKEALQCVEMLREKNFPDGRHEFKSGFMFVQRGNTKPFDKQAFEVHQKYIDVQYMIKGSELAYYEPVTALSVSKVYDEVADIAFFTGERGSELQVEAGMCWIAFPEDAHMPCRHKNSPTEYLKIVIKLPVN